MSDTRDNKSLWSKLTPEQRDELMFSLVDSRCGAEAGAALAKTWGVSTSKSAVHRFYEAERSNWTIERAKRFAIETLGMLPEELETAQRNVVRQKAFELASSSELSAKDLLKLRDQEIKLIMAQQNEVRLKQATRSLDQAQQKLEQAERRVKALEDQAEATRQANDRAKNLIKDAPMNDELRSRILKEVDEAMGIKF